MKDYSRFTAEELASDDDFARWVKHAEMYPELDSFWKGWMASHPDRLEEVEEARLMIQAVLEEPPFQPADGMQYAVWKKIQHTLYPEGKKEKTPFLYTGYSRAAILVTLLGATWLLWYSVIDHTFTSAESNPQTSAGLGKHLNNEDVPKTIVLGDGTSVVLQPHSVLEYPAQFAKELREVYLSGEAFFEVKKDPHRPFLVHANEIVTRVLGTSFMVRNYTGEQNVTVQVKTGKVSVFKDTEQKTTGEKNEVVDGVVLMPNQQVVYEREKMKMTKSLVENPSVLIPIVKQNFEFSDTPIADVFTTIEEAYGVDIVYDEEVLSNCYLNASLSDVPLYDKLKFICRGINATYEIIDSHIIIYGKGCSDQ